MMRFTDALNRVTDGPVLPEEAIEQFEQMLEATTPTVASGFWDTYGVWVIFVGAVVGIIALMLLMIAGRYRRDRVEAELGSQTSPLFADEYGTEASDDTALGGFAEVVIEDADALEEDLYDEADDVAAAEAIDTELTFDAPEAKPETVSIDHSGENVVPLRAAEAEAAHAFAETADADDGRDHQDAGTPHDEEDGQEETPRYAFATAEPQQPRETPPWRREEPAQTAAAPSASMATAQGAETGDKAPFIAPFIREDIDRSERRQNERLDALRDDMLRQVQTMKNEQASRLDMFISTIDRKLDSLDRRQAEYVDRREPSGDVSQHVTSLGGQVNRISSAIDGQGQRIRAITQILETRFAEVGLVFDEIKTVHSEIKSVREDIGKTASAVTDVRGDMDEVKEHVGRLERAILDRAAQDSATTVRLADVIRGTLPDGSYSFAATLANGETADCLISFDGLKQKIAIDAGFPMEAFHELPSRDAVRRNLPQAKAAEDSFRRGILRSILEAADRCIAAPETADSCLLFLPSEAAYTILHDRFPDLVRDSQRARVWLCSPSTLMGTLNLIRNLLPDQTDLKARVEKAEEAKEKAAEDARLRDEVAALRRRAAGLAEELDRTRGTLRDLITSTEKLSAAEDILAAEPSFEEAQGSEPEREDDEIEGLKFEGTPEWEEQDQSDEQFSKALTSLFDDDKTNTLR